MTSCISIEKLSIVLLTVALQFLGPAARADSGALDLLVGRWEVRVRTLQPEEAELTYTETYEWVLDHQFLRGRTEQKSDGTEDIVYATYDSQLQGYPFWIFSSSGTYTSLPPATWNARTRTMEWKNPPNSNISYNSRVVFRGDGVRHWTVLVKDWKGTVLLQQDGRAVRRSD